MNRKGFTLAELMVALLIAAIMISAVLSVTLSSKLNIKKSGAKADVLSSAQSVLDALKNYVVDPTQIASLPSGGVLPGDDCGAGSGGSLCSGAPNCYALAPGCVHDVTSLLPAYLREASYGARMSYVVTNPTFNGVQVSSVTVSLTWNPPQ